MKKKKYRPWLTASEVEIPTKDLRQICKNWDQQTWNNYLRWYESSRREKLIQPEIYRKIGEEQTTTLFEQFAQNISSEKRAECDRLLESLPARESAFLRQYFFEGQTERQIAAQFKLSQGHVHRIKIKALSWLKWGNPGEKGFTRQYIGGENLERHLNGRRLGDMKRMFFPIREDRPYYPHNRKHELESQKNASVRSALLSLSERQQKIIYLRYFCDFSHNQIARELDIGINVVQEIESATIQKIKQIITDKELQIMFGGCQ